MNKIIRTGLALLATLTLAFALAGCSQKTEKKLSYLTPIDGWPDITVPMNSVFVRTNISGKVENHEYMTTLTQAELMAFSEKAMEEQGWTINSVVKNSLSFVKNGDNVQFTAKQETDKGTPLFIIIEPLGAYGPSPAE